MIYVRPAAHIVGQLVKWEHIRRSTAKLANHAREATAQKTAQEVLTPVTCATVATVSSVLAQLHTSVLSVHRVTNYMTLWPMSPSPWNLRLLSRAGRALSAGVNGLILTNKLIEWTHKLDSTRSTALSAETSDAREWEFSLTSLRDVKLNMNFSKPIISRKKQFKTGTHVKRSMLKASVQKALGWSEWSAWGSTAMITYYSAANLKVTNVNQAQRKQILLGSQLVMDHIGVQLISTWWVWDAPVAGAQKINSFAQK